MKKEEATNTRANEALSALTTPEFFGMRFRNISDRWKNETGKTLADLAREAHVSVNMVSRYRKGEAIPSESVLESLLEVFNRDLTHIIIDRGYFIPTSDSEQYQHSPSYQAAYMARRLEHAEKIGLNPFFLDFISSATDFRKFPLWSPFICEYTKTPDATMKRYYRLPLMSAAAVESPFQIKDGKGKAYNLSDADLDILASIQHEAVLFIEFLYTKRAAEMKDQERRVTEEMNGKQEEGRAYPEAMARIYDSILLTQTEHAQLMRIDPLMRYLPPTDID